MNIVALDPKIAAANLHRAPFKLRHNLADHKLFTLPELVKLTLALPRDLVEYNGADIQPGQLPEDTPKLAMEPGDAVRNIEKHNAWVALKKVEYVPAYKALLEEFLSDLFTAAGTPDQPYSDLQGFIFISSASATTPFHADAEENVLVHLKGEKYIHLFDNSDRSLLSEEALELSPSEHRNRPYKPEYEEKATVYKLEPGDGLHVPYLTPHWVKTVDEYTVSIGMTWKTPEVMRLNKIRLMNGTLRRYGMPQKAPGLSPATDQLKVFTHDAARMIIDPIRKFEPARRFLRGLIYGKEANYYYDADVK